MKPDFSIARYVRQDPYKDPRDLDHLVEALRRVGLTE